MKIKRIEGQQLRVYGLSPEIADLLAAAADLEPADVCKFAILMNDYKAGDPRAIRIVKSGDIRALRAYFN